MPNTALNRTTQVLLTNKSGGNLVYGDVVIIDNTNNNGFTTTTTSGLGTRQIGVILEPNGIANNASGMVAVGGWAPRCNLNTAATVGQFIKTHTVAGQGTPHSSPQAEGDFAVALTASATPPICLFGSPNGPTAGTGTVTHSAGNLTANQLVLGNGTADILVVAATNGQVPIGKTSDGTVTLGAITGSAGVAVTLGAASIALTGTGLALITETVTAGSQASVSFTSIPATYRDLIVRVRGRGDTVANTTPVRLQFNGDTAANYHNEDLQAYSTATASVQQLAQTSARVGELVAASATASYAGSVEALIYDYRGTTFFKAMVGRFTASLGNAVFTQGVGVGSGQWISTAAITRVDVLLGAGNFVNGSIVSLYGCF